MENRKGNSDGIEIPKKKRSLDLKSLYKSKDLQVCNGEDKNTSKTLKRKLSVESGEAVGDDLSEKKKKRSDRKSEGRVSISKLGGKKSSRDLNVVHDSKDLNAEHDSKDLNELHDSKDLNEVHDELSSVSGNLKEDQDDLSQNYCNSGSSRGGAFDQKFNLISLILDDSVIQIPRRKRGSVQRKKYDWDNSKLTSLSSEKDEIANNCGRLSSDSKPEVVCASKDDSSSRKQSSKVENKLDGDLPLKPLTLSSAKDCVADSSSPVETVKVKQKKGIVDINENMLNGSILLQNIKEENVFEDFYNDKASLRKPNRSSSKRKSVVANSEIISNKSGQSHATFSVLQEDDDENLEENAARMLSSRFETSCIGVSPDNEASLSFVANGLPLPSPSVDAYGRLLRPRKQRKEKHLSRKRRHFYEITPIDLDAYWVVNRRIKVFWSLDKSWYYGIVNDYDVTKKLHHVKYDDRDEEWINLQNERFKLLLFPSEVSGKSASKTPVVCDRHAESERRDMVSEDDNCLGSYTDSEPIISWLNRSINRRKSSPLVCRKKKKSCPPSPDIVSSVLSSTIVDAHSCLGTGHSKRVEHKSSKPALAMVFDGAGEDKSVSENTSYSQDVKGPIVYYRRRLRQRSQECGPMATDIHVCGNGPEFVTPFAPLDANHWNREGYDIPFEHSDYAWPLWSLDNSRSLSLTISAEELREVKFMLSIPLVSILQNSFETMKSWLFHYHLLFTYGSVVATWPVVHLEMLFVDNAVGLSLFVFEGCLKQAISFIFLVLTAFYQQPEHGKFFDLQMPVTSFRVKLTCIDDPRKQVVFAFYNYSRVESFKWLSLEFKLRRHCLFSKEVPLIDCTYDNIKELQCGYDQLPLTSVCREPSSTEVLQSGFRKASIDVATSRKFTCLKAIQSSPRYNDRHEGLPGFSISFTAVPAFFVGLHLKLLMEGGIAPISSPDRDSVVIQDTLKSSNMSMGDPEFPVEACDNSSPVLILEDGLSTSVTVATSSIKLSCNNLLVGDDALSGCSDVDLRKQSQKYENGNPNVHETYPSPSFQDATDNGSDATVHLENPCPKSELVPRDLVCNAPSSPGRCGSVSRSHFNGISVEIPPSNQVEILVPRTTSDSLGAADLASHINDDVIHSPNPPGPRTMFSQNGISPTSSSFSPISHAWHEAKTSFYLDGLSSGPKKPRTRVSYTLPYGDFDFNSKHRHQQQKVMAHKRIRRTNEKRTIDRSKNIQSNRELLLRCDANVLITHGDRGWRESGATIAMEPVDRNEWRLVVKLSGISKYSYKAQQFLQPGSTNRYSHAMMWRGGKDWVLEFPDRSQWILFKEMHEECYNRNLRAALVKNIPIPGVHLIEEMDFNDTEVVFTRNCTKYFQQDESDVDMVLNSSSVIYDMDSDDEQWILKNKVSLESDDCGGVDISDELFEKTMDSFEKVAYTQQRDQFTIEEIEEFLFGVGPVDIIQKIYEHWRQKREKKGMPLIRQLQPPLWERYQQQLKEYEQATSKTNSVLVEKPPMVAFCLKPRGLEVPNKGSKQRSQSQRKLNSISGDHDVYHPFGRRINGFAFGEERGTTPYSHELIEAARPYSPRDVSNNGYFSKNNDGYERNYHPKHHRTKLKKIGTFSSNDSHYYGSSFSHNRTISNGNAIHPRWDVGFDRLGSSALDEFRLRDAPGSAKHARNMSKLKREKAQRLLYRADLAIHKAVVSLMTADAIKASSNKDSNDDR